MTTLRSFRPDVVATDRAMDEARELSESLDRGSLMASIAPAGGDVRPIPQELAHVLNAAVRILATGQSVTVGARPDTLTTTAAAAMLGVSRPTLMKMIRSGGIPAHRVGTHTRLFTDDVTAARSQRRSAQRVAFDALRDVESEIDDAGPRP